MYHTGGFQPIAGPPKPAQAPSIPPEGIQIVTTRTGRHLDAELLRELSRIDTEVSRRKQANPPEPFATWAMAERMTAMHQFSERQT